MTNSTYHVVKIRPHTIGFDKYYYPNIKDKGDLAVTNIVVDLTNCGYSAYNGMPRTSNIVINSNLESIVGLFKNSSNGDCVAIIEKMSEAK